MPESQSEFIPTRQSLLERLRDLDDQASWLDFYNTYARLIHGVARKSGLSEEEAQEAVQETVIAVARHMPGFVYDPARCSFKSWLLMITRQRVIWQARQRAKAGHVSSDATDDTTRTPTTESIPDPAGLEWEAVWEAEWQNNLLAAALERVKAQVSAKQFQIFDLVVLQSWPVKDVARTLQVSAAQVYLAKHRLSRLVKKEVGRLNRSDK